MRQYVVTEGCYVPVGDQGDTRFKVAGQVVTLDERDAKALGGLVKPASERTVAAQVVVNQAADDTDGDAPDGDAPAPDGDAPEAPAVSDVKADWVDFAVSQGESREAAEAMTKADLIDKFG